MASVTSQIQHLSLRDAQSNSQLTEELDIMQDAFLDLQQEHCALKERVMKLQEEIELLKKSCSKARPRTRRGEKGLIHF